MAAKTIQEISEELKKQEKLWGTVVKLLTEGGKQLKANTASSKEYTGVVRIIAKIHDEYLGGLTKGSRLVYDLIHKYSQSTDSTLKATVQGQQNRLQELAKLRAKLFANQANLDERGPTRALMDERRELIQQEDDLKAAAEETGGATAGIAGWMGKATRAAADFETVLRRAGPEMGIITLGIEGFNHLVANSRAFNTTLINANSSLENRDRLFTAALDTSIKLHRSQQEMSQILASMVIHGQQFGANVESNLTKAGELVYGLGLSVDASTELMASAQGTSQSYQDLADTLADVQGRLGMSADSAAKMAISINQVIPYLGTSQVGPGTTSRFLESLGPYAQALTAANRDDLNQEFMTLMAQALKNPLTMWGMATAGKNGFDPDRMGSILMTISEDVSKQSDEVSKKYEAIMDLRRAGLGDDATDLVMNLAGDVKAFNDQMANNPAFAERIRLDNVYKQQMAATLPVMTQLKNSFDSLVTEASIPLLNEFTKLVPAISDLLDYIAKQIHPRTDDSLKGLLDTGDVVVGADYLLKVMQNFGKQLSPYDPEENALRWAQSVGIIPKDFYIPPTADAPRLSIHDALANALLSVAPTGVIPANVANATKIDSAGDPVNPNWMEATQQAMVAAQTKQVVESALDASGQYFAYASKKSTSEGMQKAIDDLKAHLTLLHGKLHWQLDKNATRGLAAATRDTDIKVLSNFTQNAQPAK